MDAPGSLIPERDEKHWDSAAFASVPTESAGFSTRQEAAWLVHEPEKTRVTLGLVSGGEPCQ